MSQAAVTIQQKMIKALLKRKRHYEKYLNALDGVDNPAQSALNSILKTIVDITYKMDPEGPADPEAGKRKAREIFESDYGVKRN